MLINEKINELRLLKPFYSLSDNERDNLYQTLSLIKSNPYKELNLFKNEIKRLITEKNIPQFFIDLCNVRVNQNHLHQPFFYLRNIPIDKVLPIFDEENPVESKYELKKTFIVEAFLELFAQMVNTPSIGYKNVNNGDIYQDIFPKKSMWDTQSQKALKNIGFHKDLANHFVRPDYVNMLALRNSEENLVVTTFVVNYDLLNSLDDKILRILKEKIFYTPYDVLTLYGDEKNELGETSMHSIIEGRTISDSKKGSDAIKVLNQKLHEMKFSHHFLPNDFISVENNKSIHGKEVILLNNLDQLKTRWLMKTVNVCDLAEHEKYYLKNNYGIVNG